MKFRFYQAQSAQLFALITTVSIVTHAAASSAPIKAVTNAAKFKTTVTKTETAKTETTKTALALSAENARLRDEKSASVARLKTLVRAALQLAEQNSDRLVLTNRAFLTQLQPFLQSNENQKASAETPSFANYSFNDNLQRAWTYALQEPQEIVLFYEGANRKLRFRANGLSVVAFADGSVRSVTKLQAQSLRWWKDRVLDVAEQGDWALKLDQTTPEKTALSFIKALNRGRFDLARACVRDAKALSKTEIENEAEAIPVYEVSGDETKTDEKKTVEARFSNRAPQGWDKARFALEISDIQRVEMQHDAVAMINYRVRMGMGALSDSGQILFMLDAKTKVWRIVPSDFSGDISTLSQNPISVLAAYLLNDAASPDAAFRLAQIESLRFQSVSNLRQIGLAVMKFVQEYDEKIDFDTNSFKQKIFPYANDESIYHSPLSGEPYALNPFVAGRGLAEFNSPSQTVLFYEGANGVLDFAYNGNAVIGFLDGHVSSVTPERARQLIWNPFS